MKTIVKYIHVMLPMLVVSSLALGANNGNGNGNGGNPHAAIQQLQDDLAALQQTVSDLDASLSADIDQVAADLAAFSSSASADIDLLFTLVTGMGSVVTADCTSDGSALQTAIDQAGPNGTVIQLVGACDAAIAQGKTNIVIDGAGTASIEGSTADSLAAALTIEASSNIQVIGVTLNANGDPAALAARDSNVFVYNNDVNGNFEIARGAFAAIADNAVTGILNLNYNAVAISDGALSVGANLTVNYNSTFVQVSGSVDVDGVVGANYNSVVIVTNGDIAGSAGLAVSISRGAQLTFLPGAGKTVSSSGDISLFTNSTMFSFPAGGNVSLSGSAVLVQRLSTFFVIGGGSSTTSMDFATVTALQNSLLDLLGATYVSTPAIDLSLGSGARAAGTALTATCDASVWVAFSISCL